MTLDEAIKHCLDIADGQDKCAEISVSEHAKERISQCAADHRQLAEWLTELKEAKRLLKAAVEDIQQLNELTVDNEGGCLIEKQVEIETCLECPLNTGNSHYCGWRHQVEALALIGEDTNVPAREDGAENG